MKIITKAEFLSLAKTKKLSLLQESPEAYEGGFKPNPNSIYALNKSNHLVAFYCAPVDEYHLYDKPKKQFSKTRRKFTTYSEK